MRRLILPFLGALALTAALGVGPALAHSIVDSSAPSSSSGSNAGLWVDVYNCSAADAGFDTYSADSFPDAGPHTLCTDTAGAPVPVWYTSHGHAASASILDGGLYTWPDSSSDYWTTGNTMPEWRWQISRLYPAFTLSTPIRVAFNLCGSNLDGSSFVGFEGGLELDDGPAQHYAVLVSSSTSVGSQSFNANADSVDTGATVPSDARNGMARVTLPNGVGQFQPASDVALNIGTSIWPVDSTAVQAGGGVLSGAIPGSNFGDPSRWYAFAGFKRSGSGTAIYGHICGIRVQVKVQ